MAGLASLLPRFVALPLVVLLGTATLTFAANSQLTSPSTPAEPAVSALPTVLVVPDVRRQAFVFAKGTLEDAGFSWKVSGSVEGFAANIVSSQSPEPGTRVVDTGNPTIQVTLAANGQYKQEGSPENGAPYPGTAVKVAGAETPAVTPAPDVEPAAPAAQPRPAAKAEGDHFELTTGLYRAGRHRRAPRRDGAARTRQGARPLRRVAPGQHRQRQPLPLPARLDRHRSRVRLVAWSRGARPSRRRRSPGPAALGLSGAKSESVARAALARVKAKSAR